MRQLFLILSVLIAALAIPAPASAEDGYKLWMRYRPLAPAWHQRYDSHATMFVSQGDSETLRASIRELQMGMEGMLGHIMPRVDDVAADGTIVIGTPQSSPIIADLELPLANLGKEGFLIRSVMIGDRRAIVIAANSDLGVLYGVFRFLRQMQLRGSLEKLDIADAPKLQRRMLNHWDNMDRHVERGYAGLSLWDWQTLPRFKDPRYTDYARANASIGINGTVLNNVNANAVILKGDYLVKVKALADMFRPYGIKVYLTARFSAPIEIGGLKTADPLDPAVAAWWRAKVDEIYSVIPDFGGFLIKANSEGQPGPGDYRRTHADGANMLADALKPHGGIVMWRAFVYSAENAEDRHKQAYADFVPLDGTFRDNVLVQVKNGAIDFQPREPFHPIFGAMPKTPLMMEFQITKEYLGFSTHLAFLGTMWEEALDADTFRPKGDTVANVLEKPVSPGAVTGIAGVANIGNSRSWSGSQFDQANWYTYGRMAWDPQAGAEGIARDWATMTWSDDPATVDAIVGMMMGSREAVVDYTGALGLGHLFATGHHYGPGPWVSELARPEWNPVYYHKADANGIGFDRTKTGSNALSQYAPELEKRWGNLKTVPDEMLLWFHHVSWDYRLKSGRTVWNELIYRYDRGVGQVRAMIASWEKLKGKVDDKRWNEVRMYLDIQLDEAIWWRDASVAYFQSVSKRPLPEGHAPPTHDLDWYKAIQTPYAPGRG